MANKKEKVEKVRLNLHLDINLYNEIDKLASKTNRTKVSIITEACIAYMTSYHFQEELQRKLIEEPAKLVDVAKAMDLNIKDYLPPIKAPEKDFALKDFEKVAK